MYEVHKYVSSPCILITTDNSRFMAISYAEITYFIEQVGMSAASFGVTTEDVTTIGEALMGAFGYRCAPPITIVKAQGPQLQAICTDSTCPISPNATCASYNATMEPGNATMTSSASGSMSSPTGTSTTSPPATVSKGAGASITFSFAAIAGGLAAMFL